MSRNTKIYYTIVVIISQTKQKAVTYIFYEREQIKLILSCILKNEVSFSTWDNLKVWLKRTTADEIVFAC